MLILKSIGISLILLIIMVTLTSVLQWLRSKLLEHRVNQIRSASKEKPFKFFYKKKPVEIYSVLDKGECEPWAFNLPLYSKLTIYINGNPVAAIHKFERELIATRRVTYNMKFKTNGLESLIKSMCKANKMDWNKHWKESLAKQQEIF